MTEGQALQGLVGAIAAIDAPDEVILRDHQGGEHRWKTLLPARRQVQVFRALARLIESGGRSLSSAPSGVAAVAQLLMDDEIVEQLGRIFRVAYDFDGDPLDQFPLEELVAALVPLVARFLRRSASAVLG
jgi:hypothetical protein